MTVTTKVIAQAGSIVDAAVAAGANTVSGPSLSPSNQAALQRAALKAAVADAHGRALAIAQAAHVRLGAVRTVSEGTSTPDHLRRGAEGRRRGAGDAGRAGDGSGRGGRDRHLRDRLTHAPAPATALIPHTIS